MYEIQKPINTKKKTIDINKVNLYVRIFDIFCSLLQLKK